MNKDQAAALREADRLELEARRSIALASPLGYATYHNTSFLSPAHVQLMSDTITRFVQDKLLKPDGTAYKRLMINMPPRHGKSELCTRVTPAWYLTNWPDREVIVTGHGSEFAADFGNDIRNLINSHPELGVELDPSTAAKDNFKIKDHRGAMRAVGAGGPITGRGAHLFVIDDPVKSDEDADSPRMREKLWNWWQGTILSRLMPLTIPAEGEEALPDDMGHIIMIMTRWHEDDIAGRTLAAEPESWAQLTFPALATHSEGLDRLGRAPGEALWPAMYNKTYLEGLQNSMSSRWFSALYQQSPSIQGGNMFKAENFRYWTPRNTANGLVFQYTTPGGTFKEVRNDEIWRFSTLDLAATEKKTADYTVGAVWGVTPDRELLLLDMVRTRIESAEHESFVRMLGAKHKLRYHGVEKATYGLTLIQIMRRMGLPVLELLPDKDKVSRAWPAVGFIEHGAIYFPKSAPWLFAYELELQQFPNAANDDMVDVTSYAAQHLADRVRPTSKEKPPPPPANTVNVDAIIKAKKRAQRINVRDSW